MNRIGKPLSDKSWADELSWHMSRAKGVGGSEIAILMGDSPWGTPFQLWEYKTGNRESKDISSLPHIQRGVLGEKIARKILERRFGVEFTPHTWVIEDTPYRCSDDGYSASVNELLEIKCMSAAAHEKIKGALDEATTYKQEIAAIPVYYLHQCIWNLFVSGAAYCRFVSFNPETEDICEVLVRPDEKMAKKYCTKVDKFWEQVITKTAPKFSDKDQIQIKGDDKFTRLEQDWLSAKDQIEMLAENIKDIEEQLKQYTGRHPKVRGRIVQITRSIRAGSVDYKKAFADNKISEDDYRREPSSCIRISRVKQDDA